MVFCIRPPPAVVRATASRPLFASLYAAPRQPEYLRQSQLREYHHTPYNCPRSAQTMGDLGIRLLAIRNFCQRHSQHDWVGRDYTERSIYHRARRKRPLATVESWREVSDDATSRGAPEPPPPWYRNPPTLDELKSLVDMYNVDGYGEEKQEEEKDRKAESDTNTNSEDDPQEWHTSQNEWDSDTNHTLGKLAKLLRQARPDSHVAFELYKSLPYPRVAYLDYKSVRKFLNCLAWVERKNEASMMRYLSVIDDMKACNMPIALADWSTAIHFVGRCFRKVDESEVESALYVWREMEYEADVRGNRVTFSILFDIATKAGKHRLAEMILKEMESRKLKFDRHFYVSFIHYQGLRGDGDAVRKAYVNLVDSGAIVDTAVLNCVITALITAGELPAAEQVFAGMKDLHNRGEAKTVPSHWSKRREIGKLLTRVSLLVKDPEQRALFQKATPVGPDHATFKILIKYHTITSGNIDRISELLHEMGNDYQISPNGDLYYTLFHGFHHHGGIPYSSWTLVKLEELWAAYRNAIYNRVPEFKVDKAIAKAIILAFEKVVSGDRTWEVWEELKSMWKSPNAADLEEVNDRLMWLLQKRRRTDGLGSRTTPGWDGWRGRNHRSR
ncbi:hypothetical protein IWX90DRAFT_420308 [Phyllosticta citrichinensis]|uniref:Pentatricopeptide repeat protein n=1 Tax=Phyllosticta citrichinensis TaxID=1130410 RepID=A0ABR1Y5I8_9PEZI